MDKDYFEDTKSFNNSNDYVMNRSMGDKAKIVNIGYNWLERYIPYEGPYWFYRFPND